MNKMFVSLKFEVYLKHSFYIQKHIRTRKINLIHLITSIYYEFYPMTSVITYTASLSQPQTTRLRFTDTELIGLWSWGIKEETSCWFLVPSILSQGLSSTEKSISPDKTRQNHTVHIPFEWIKVVQQLQILPCVHVARDKEYRITIEKKNNWK